MDNRLTNAKTTEELLLERYNSLNRRPTVADPAARRFIFLSFQRVLGPYLPARRDAAILDVACGEGSLLAFLREKGYVNLAGFDLSPENVRICRASGLGFVHEDDAVVFARRQDDARYDVLFLLDILEHLPKEDVGPFLTALRDKLKPGGALVIQTPNMGSVMGVFQRYNDLTHVFGLTEKTAVDLMMIAGFTEEEIEIGPAWSATTVLGRVREVWLSVLHHALFLAEDSSRPRIPTKNLLIRAIRS